MAGAFHARKNLRKNYSKLMLNRSRLYLVKASSYGGRMAESIGRITAHLAGPIETISEEIILLINENIKPPNPVGAGDVFVRAMYVVSDEINSFGGRFPAEEHNRLAALLIDSPVLVGHRKDKLPVPNTT